MDSKHLASLSLAHLLHSVCFCLLLGSLMSETPAGHHFVFEKAAILFSS